MLAELSIFPLDKGGSGLSTYVAESVKIIEESGLDYEIHALGTLVEGPSDAIFDLMKRLHANMVRHSDRVMMTVKIDDRKGVQGAIRQKVKSVTDKLPR